MKIGIWLLAFGLAVVAVLTYFNTIELPEVINDIKPIWIMTLALGLVAFGNVFKVRDRD